MTDKEKENFEENNNVDQSEENKQDSQSESHEDEQLLENDEISKIKADFENINNQYIRLAADFENYRKRQAQEREALLKYGAEETLKKILPVLDTFNRAAESFESMEDCEKLKESFNVVNKQLTDALEKSGLKKIETIGQEFNPNKHEAVMQTPTSEHPDQSIIAELQSGYMIGDRVLRAAMVNVAVCE